MQRGRWFRRDLCELYECLRNLIEYQRKLLHREASSKARGQILYTGQCVVRLASFHAVGVADKLKFAYHEWKDYAVGVATDRYYRMSRTEVDF